MTETDKLYQSLVKQSEEFFNMVESQDQDARCVSKDDPDALSRLARRLNQNLDAANDHLDIIHRKLDRDYNAAAGMTLWQLGYIGEILFPIDGSPGLLDDTVKVSDWLKENHIKRQRFQDARNARKRFKIQDARKLGYRGMMQTIRDEQRPKPNPNEEDNDDKNKKNPSKRNGGKVWTLRGDLTQTHERIVSQLTTTNKKLLYAPDLNPDSDEEGRKNYAAIIAARALLKEAYELLFDVQAKLDEAEELNPGDDSDKAKRIRDELRIHRAPSDKLRVHEVSGDEDHDQQEVSALLSAPS